MGGGKAEGLPNQHLPEAQPPAQPDPSLTGKEQPLPFSRELLPPPSALQEMIHLVPDQSKGSVRDLDVQRS